MTSLGLAFGALAGFLAAFIGVYLLAAFRDMPNDGRLP